MNYWFYEDVKDKIPQEKLIDFVEFCDQYFAPPLSSRNICIQEYVSKIIKDGRIILAFDKCDMVGACFFYCNDQKTHKAFGSWLCVLPEYRAKGIVLVLLSKSLQAAKEAKMKKFELQTSDESLLGVYQRGFGGRIIGEHLLGNVRKRIVLIDLEGKVPVF